MASHSTLYLTSRPYQLLREIVSVVQCSFKMLSIFSCEPAVIPAERANATEVLGQTIRPAGQSKMFKVPFTRFHVHLVSPLYPRDSNGPLIDVCSLCAIALAGNRRV